MNLKSSFAPDLEIGQAAYLTEQIILNKLRKLKREIPRCAFWRKEVVAEHTEYKYLNEQFIVEMGMMHNLLRSFSFETILKYINSHPQLLTFKYLKLPEQKTLVYNLWQADVKIKRERDKMAKGKKKEKGATVVQKRKSQKSKLTGMDLL